MKITIIINGNTAIARFWFSFIARITQYSIPIIGHYSHCIENERFDQHNCDQNTKLNFISTHFEH